MSKSNKPAQPKFVVITDTHADKNNYQHVEQIWNQAFQVCSGLGCKNLIHCGDIFTSRTGQGLAELTSFLNVLTSAQRNSIHIWAIAGNHDKTDLDSPESYLDVFQHHPNFTLFREESVCEINSVNCCFLPYFKENSSYPQRLKNLGLKAKKDSILFTHIAVDGVVNNDGSKVENDLKIDLFSQFKICFSGHYHNRSKIKNVQYIGSTDPRDFSEDNLKGVCVVYDDLSYELLELNFKKFMSVKITQKDEFDVKELLTDLSNFQDDNLRLILEGDENWLLNFPEQPFKNQGIVIKRKNTETQHYIDRAELNEFKPLDFQELLSNFNFFCSENKITPKQKITGLKILKNLNNV